MLPKYLLIVAIVATIATIGVKPVQVHSQAYGQRIKPRIISPEVNEKDFRAPYDLPDNYSNGQTETSTYKSEPKITSYSNNHHHESGQVLQYSYQSDQSQPAVYVPAHYAERRNDDVPQAFQHYSIEPRPIGYGPTPIAGIFYPQAKHIPTIQADSSPESHSSEHHSQVHRPVTIVIPPRTLNAAIHHSIFSQPIKYSSEHSGKHEAEAYALGHKPQTVAITSNESEVKHSTEQSIPSRPADHAALNSVLRSDESYLIYSKPRRNYESTYASYSISSGPTDSTGEKDEENNSYRAFEFSYDNTDEYGTQMARAETGDDSGKVTGTYSYRDINGMARIVRYIADHEGFRAQIQTNEPGTETSNPADAQIISSNPGPHEKPE